MSEKKSVSSLLIALLGAIFCIGLVNAGFDVSNINVNDLQQQLPSEFANSNYSIEDAKSLFRNKCIEVAGDEKGLAAYNDIELSVVSLTECLTSIVNYTAIQQEIEEASPRGELDAVFNKYCNKRDNATKCIEDFNEKLLPCLDNDERESQAVFMRIARSLLNFVCYKGGDQIALFIAEKGPECLESKKDDIQQCINSTFSGYVPEEGLENVKKLPKFVLGQKQCNDIQNLEACIVNKLEKCPEITPANIIESMFRFIKNETICRNSTPTLALHSGSSGAGFSVMPNLNAAVLALILFFFTSQRLQS